MKIFALLSWYDETPEMLTAVVESAAGLCDHVIAVDGAYALYPHVRPTSHPAQAEAIVTASAEMGCTLVTHVLAPWRDEVSKRAAMFRIALDLADPDDWFLILDADMVVTPESNLTQARSQLWDTDRDVAEITLHVGDSSTQPFRSLFRALPGLTVDGLHYVYTTVKDGRRVFLWHPPDNDEPVEPALDLTAQLAIEHRVGTRRAARQTAAQMYYSRRQERAPVYA